jgi:EpsI family protein
MAGLLSSRRARILTLVLLVQAGVFYGFSRSEKIPARKSLADFSPEGTPWRMTEDVQMDQETLDVLKADDILSRVYTNKEDGRAATLFVAYFATQRTGKTPHSPKNCLPGSGWAPSQSGTIEIPVPGEHAPITVNRYVVSRGDNQSVVLYWYQARNRVVASEYAAKIFTVTDSIRYNRSDTALVRVIAGVDGGNTQRAVDTVVAFVQSFFQPLKQYLPS